MTTDPNRLLVIIKDRHILIDRLGKILAMAKKDNAGDAFKINRLMKHHKHLLSELEDYLRSLITDKKQLEAIRYRDRLREEEAALERLRIEVNTWGLE